MKSNDEEYLDSLLNSAQKSNNSNPQSALSRMSGRKASGSASNGSGDIGALVDNSNGNKDLGEIGSLLDKLDSGVMVDEAMADLLDDIETPTDADIPTFTVGGTPTANDVRDPEEIALDEAIADAERLDEEIRNGKFNEAPASGKGPGAEEAPLPEANPVASPIVDLEEGDDALLEMAPEVSLPEDNEIIFESKQDTDADQTPEEILTDLLDDMPDNDLTAPSDEAVQESLNDALDNIKEEELNLGNLEAAMDGDANEDVAEEPVAEPSGYLSDLDNLSLDDLANEAGLDAGLQEPQDEAAVEEIATEDALTEESPSEEPSLDDLMAEVGMTDETISGEEPSAEDAPAEVGSEEAPAEVPPEAPAEDNSAEESPPAAEMTLDEMSEDDFNLDALEASLDNLLGGEEADSSATDGEVAALADIAESNAAASEEAGNDEVSMQDLDALMNSLANDEIEDIESTAQKDEESGHAEESEIPKEDILSALTEDGFGDIGAEEPSLDELASIPDRSSGGESSDEDEPKGKNKKEKKEKKEGFFARLIKALTREDEEPDGEGLASLTDENQQVLNELGEEGAPAKGGKKKKEKKEKKPKKEKPKKEKPPKEKKPPKPKKEKKPKPPKDPGVPEKAISPKKVALAFIFAVSLGVLVCIPAVVLPNRIASQRAASAYTHKEYTTAYKMLYGKEKNEDETIIYEQSRVLAWAQRYLDGYENYTAMNMKEEALDMLLMAMRNQEDLLEEAEKYSVATEVNSVYDSIVSLLSEGYGLTEADIAEINSIKKDRDYTIRLMEIVGTIES